MPAMRAYLDDFGKVTMWVNKYFYGGKIDTFWLIADKGYTQALAIMGVEEHEDKIKYQLSCPKDIVFGRDYKIRDCHGMIVPLEFRLIVKKDLFHKMFTYDGEDLGAIYHPMHTDFALWAPTAVSVVLSLKMGNKRYSYTMTRTERGVWRMSVYGDLSGATYVYYVERNGQVVRSLDPYALSSTGNGWESAVIDLAKVKSVPTVRPKTPYCCGVDAILYEMSVRDMTSLPEAGTSTHGKYLSLTESGTHFRDFPTGMDYIQSLGITHVQLMPVLDFTTVDEFHPELNYNWGYDPAQYLTLEGSYASDPDDPYCRMKELRKLVSAFHERDIRVNLDVVFNHMYDVDSCAFQTAVPYYYFRYGKEGHLSNGSYCGNDFASEMPMARKYLVHVIDMLMRLYDVDGFRFDLMGILDVDTMNAIYRRASSIKKDAMIYGEGWDMPTTLDGKKKASIMNQNVMPHIGHFNDYFRDVIKGKTSDDAKYARGYATGDIGQGFSMLSALAGNVMGEPLFRRFEEPDQTINNIETHDNSTVWDKMHACCGNEERATRYMRHKMMILSVLVSQGIPFLHAGLEFCATKSNNSNSYNAGDVVNGIDWQRAYYNRHMIEYTKKCIRLRKKYPEFRLHTTKEIYDRLLLSSRDDGTVSYTIRSKDGSCGYSKILVLINPTDTDKCYDCEDGWTVIFDENGDAIDGTIDRMFLPSKTMIIFKR